ncbi:MAG: carboxylate--amine ligase [Epsilonproteobacteria bacterium]|jgi:carbamoyl-phosphate synthase large subunit|nr:carboxylate--amine ligase [Campylobacterota bacterium]NPA88796.1 carboxylate--amine ligase [Campylobacterota bacterium]
MIIGISGLNNTDNPAPGVGVAKGLLEKHTLIGLSYDPNEPGIYQGLFSKVYLMPYPSVGAEEFKQRLRYIKEQTGLEAVIPTLDAELYLYIKYQKELEKDLGIKTFLPSLSQFERREKAKLAQLAEELGIKSPKTYQLFSVEELIKLLRDGDELKFPVMVKGNYYRAYKASNLEEAIEYFYKISNEWGFPILLQEVVSGEEINYLGLGNRGKLVGGIGIKKLTTTDIGKIWNGITIENPTLLKLAREFVEKTQWNGAFELECISNGREIYLIEINPRFPAWVHFATAVGVNLPQMVVDLMEGKEVEPQLDYPSQKMYVRYVDEVVTDFKLFRQILTKKEL